MEKVVVITGPTAVGKTRLAIAVAKHFNTELINGDAYQVYRKMNIGTAKPNPNELQQVKHHIIDYLDPRDNFSVFDYQQTVRKKITEFESEKKLPIIVGGSGLYIDSVIYDYRFSDAARSEQITDQYLKLSNQELHYLLAELDPKSASCLHMNNRKRVLRAIELAQNPSNEEERNKKDQPFYQALIIFLNDDRQALYERIDQRVDKMVKDGLFDEVASFYPDQLSTQAKEAIGYKQIFQYFAGVLTYEDTIQKIKQATRNYAKRQLTWFRNHRDVIVTDIDADNFQNTIDYVNSIINDFIKN